MVTYKKKMKKQTTIEYIERKQEELDLEKERLGIEVGMTEEEKELMATPLYGENTQKISVGLGTMIMGRLLFGKFSNKQNETQNN